MPIRHAFAAALFFGLATARGAEPEAGLTGTVTGDTYTAPKGIYGVTIPVLPEFGGQVHDTDNVVTFDDNVNLHASIACFPLDLTQRWEFETRGTRDYLTQFYAEFVLKDFQSRFPGSSAETTLFVPEFLGGSLLGYALLPGGSAFAARDTIGAGAEPAVAKRGNLLFIKSGFIYIVSIELAERVTQRSVFHKTAKEEDEILRDRLMKLAGHIHFPAPKPEAAGHD